MCCLPEEGAGGTVADGDTFRSESPLGNDPSPATSLALRTGHHATVSRLLSCCPHCQLCCVGFLPLKEGSGLLLLPTCPNPAPHSWFPVTLLAESGCPCGAGPDHTQVRGTLDG